MKKTFKAGLTPVIVGLLALFFTGCSAGMKASWHLRRGNHYYAAGQFDQAEIEYLNVVRNNPENFLAISRLGEIYYTQGRMQNASQFLYRAAQLNTNDLPVRIRLGQLYQNAGKLPAARAEATFVLDREPQNADAMITLAESADQPETIAAVRQYLNRLPPAASQPALSVALGILALQEKDYKTAGADFLRAQTQDPKFAMASSALGILYQMQNNSKQAETEFKAAADLSPLRSELRLNYAAFEIQTGHPDVAEAFLAENLQQTPDLVPAWIQRAQVAMSAKKYDECSNYLAMARSLDPENYDAALLTGQLALEQGDTAKARTLMEHLARQYYQIPRVHYLLALTCLASHEVNAAVISLNRALSLDTNFTDASLLLAEIQIKSGTPDPAVSLLRQVIGREPNLAQARLLLADGYRAQHKPGDALAVYDQMAKDSPRNPGVPLLKGFTFEEQQDNASARRAFLQALALAPNDLRVLDALMQLDLSEKQYEPAIQTLEKALAGSDQKYQLYLMEAKVFEAQGNASRTMAALFNATKINPDAPSAHLVLAQHYLKDKKYPEALAELQTALQKDPASSSAWMLKGQILNEMKEPQGSADAFQQMLVIDPQSSVALNNLAYLYAEYLGQLDKAYDMAKKARDLLPFDPSTADTMGWVLFHRGDYASALGFLEESLGKLPQSPDVQYHFGKVNYMLGQETAATTALQKALQLNPSFEGHEECQRCLDLLAIDPSQISPAGRASLEKRIVEIPNDPVALSRLAAVYKLSGDNDRAVQVDQAILQANPNNIQAMLELGRLYSLKNVPKAFAMAKNAYAAAPQNSDASYLLGKLAYQTGDYKWAWSLLKQTAQTEADNANVQFDLAKAAYSMGDVAAARVSFQNALDLGLPAAQADQARQWLDLLAAAEQPALARSAGPRSELILKTDPENVPALMVSALVFEQQSNPAAAGQIYEKVLNLFPDFAPAQKKLAMVYARGPRRMGDAYALAIKAREAFPDDPDLPRLLGMILCQQGDYQQAINYLTLSAPTHPDDAELFYNLGLSQYHLKYLGDSKASLKRALELKLPGPLADEAQKMLREIK